MKCLRRLWGLGFQISRVRFCDGFAYMVSRSVFKIWVSCLEFKVPVVVFGVKGLESVASVFMFRLINCQPRIPRIHAYLKEISKSRPDSGLVLSHFQSESFFDRFKVFSPRAPAV